ncbi:ABC transporter substrate-binding protein [Marivirga sp. S37H4]|uniref:ABC transporter substrate-binding protein n=1 Tax=Marivirga aurantiaca TaxID=2802615 RepID=A0A934WWH1_9BACT|nr:ABC transporter substrate-binding protein [Marivirga aurantiaca]MBK6264110.1 ABC transporter substrate-binding protein [Marivirga aurantiaca]
MHNINVSILLVLLLFTIVACENDPTQDSLNIQEMSWEDISDQAKGSTVNFMMWQGDADINDYINNYVAPTLKEKYNIRLNIIGGQGPEIVQLVMGEKQAGVKKGQADIVWINGETFFQLRKIEGLWGPFVQKLPNAQYIDFDNSFINTDFQQPVNNMEAPWGINQFAIIYDSAQISNPPRNLQELENFIKANPGFFTISNDFSGMTLLKSFLAELSGSPTGLDGPFDEEKYQKLSTRLWDYINRNKRYFWKEGTTFPKEHSKMNQMFASGELKISFGFSEGGVESKVRQGLYPKSTRAYAWDNGTIRNANYLGITYNSSNKAAAMEVINFLISPEAQLKKSDPTGMDSNPVLSIDKLDPEWKSKFEASPKRIYGAQLSDLANKAIQEPAPEYMIRLYEDFRKKVIEK